MIYEIKTLLSMGQEKDLGNGIFSKNYFATVGIVDELKGFVKHENKEVGYLLGDTEEQIEGKAKGIFAEILLKKYNS